ncbi:MAG: class I SAM-dependent methyltransferase [Actinomycetota bacterium]
MGTGGRPVGRLRRYLVDDVGSAGQRARGRRQALLAELFPDLQTYRVLDLGGRLAFWERIERRPAHVVALNPLAQGESASWFDGRDGDACDPPADVAADAFDLVFSNSTIEHVGDAARRLAFADVVRELAPRHWVQTPNRHFPIEPHWLAPGVQYLPVWGRAVFSRYWPLVHTRARDWPAARRHAAGTELIARGELARLFPDSEIHEERWAGMTKSLVAVLK